MFAGRIHILKTMRTSRANITVLGMVVRETRCAVRAKAVVREVPALVERTGPSARYSGHNSPLVQPYGPS